MTNFHKINWKQCLAELQENQENLTRSYREGKPKQIKTIQSKILTSFATRALAVRKVNTNKGGKTPGTDGVMWETPMEKAHAIKEIHYWTQNPKQYRAKPVKRMNIPKPGKAETRPLGIPTMLDRAMQEVYRASLDPIVEETSDPNSYGFRKYRGCSEAIAKLAGCLNRDFSAAWVLDADIEKCFDTMNHEWLIKNTPIVHKQVLESWLKAGVEVFGKTDYLGQGTPQGGVISPLLCNVCLNGLEKQVHESVSSKFKRKFPKVHVVRYADDFIITAAEPKILEILLETAKDFLKPRGLKIHPKKTKILNIYEEKFTFLGFEFFKKPLDTRRNRPSEKGNTKYRLIYRPGSKNVQELKKKVKNVLDKHQTSNILTVIKELNPLLRGWAEYFRISRQSMRTYANLRQTMWFSMLRWAKNKYRRRSSAEIIKICTGKYEKQVNQWRWRKGKKKVWLYRIDQAKYLFIPKLTETKLNPYVKSEREQLEERALKISIRRKEGLRKTLTRLQKGKCPMCSELLESEQYCEIHHIKPKRKGGKTVLENLALMHRTCHHILHLNKPISSATEKSQINA